MANNRYEIDISTNAETSSIEELAEKLNEVEEMAKEASESLEEMSDSADETGSSIDNIDGSPLDDVSSSASDASGGLDETTESANELLSTLVELESVQILAEIGSQAEDVAQSVNANAISVGQLATNIGMAESETISLVNSISNVTFPIDEAMQYVGALSQMGVETNDLAQSATNMDVINDAFGIGSDKVVTLTGSLRALGVDVNNLDSTYNALAFSQANITGGVGTFTDVLSKSAPELQEMGLSVDQTAVALSAFEQQTGFTGRKLNSEFRKALDESNGDISTLEEKLGVMPGTLASASEATSQYSGQVEKLADEEAEHKTILDHVGQAYDELSLYIGDVLSPLSSFAGGLGEVLRILPGVTAAQTLLKDSFVMDKLQSAGGALVEYGSKAIQAGKDVLSSAYKMLSGAAIRVKSFAVDKLKSAGGALLDYGKDAISAGRKVLTGAYTMLSAAATRVSAWIMELPGKIANTAANWALAASEYALLLPIILVVAAIIAVVAILWHLYNTNETVRAGVDWLISAFWNFVDFLKGLPAAIQSFVSGAVKHISQLPGKIWNYLSQTITKVVSWGVNLVSSGITAATNFVTNVVNQAKQLPDKVYQSIVGVVKRVTDIFKDLYEGVKKWWDELWNLDWNFGGSAGGLEPGNTGYYAGAPEPSTASLGYNASEFSNLSAGSNSSKKGNTFYVEINNDISGVMSSDEAREFIGTKFNEYLKMELIRSGKVVP